MLRPMDVVPATAPLHVRAEIGDAFFVSGVFAAPRLTAPRGAHHGLHVIHTMSETPMFAPITLTRSKRLAGIGRFAAPARLTAAGGDVCVDARRLGALPSDQLRPVADVAPRGHLVEIGDAVAKGQHDEQIRKTSFNAGVRIGARPG